MARKRMSAEERKISIIQATIRAVSRTNYDRATTSMIAKEAGITEALIYKHFKNKQDLHVAVLDYLAQYHLQIYKANPAFQETHKNQSVIKALNAQYLEYIQRPDVDMFSCILKSFFAMDERIREKGWECALAFHEFIKSYLIEDRNRGFFGEGFDPETIAWGLQGSLMLVSTFAVINKLDASKIENIKKSHQYFEQVYMHQKRKVP